jgi:hypothetical protein
MKNLFPILVFTLSLIPGMNKAQSNIQLFNHNNLDGWYAYNAESGKHENASELFHEEDGMIRLYGSEAGYLMSDQSFHNFRLTVQFRWNTDTRFTRKNNNKNSGIMYLVPSESPDMLWPEGIQFQVKEGATGDFILLQNVTLNIHGTETEAGPSTVIKRNADATKPAGEWNTAVITFQDGKITQMLNGKLVNEGRNPSVSKGRILLQYEGYPIDFRQVDIEKL